MNKTKFKFAKFTKPELDRYVRDKNSCISLVNSEMHVGFPPWGFATFQETLTNIIGREKIGKFDTKLDGIVLDVRNIKVFGTSYAVHDDDPYNHINIKANFYVFKPRVGVVVKGIVKHISHGHVAVIIYRVFNVSIRFSSAEVRERLQINQQITFRMKRFDLHGAMPSIEGELLNIRVDKPPQPIATTPNRSHVKFDDGDDDAGADSGISNGDSSAVQKKSKKIAESSDSSDSSDSEDRDKSDLIKQLMFENVKVKEEKFSDSEEETKYKKQSRRSSTEDSSSSDSSDDDDDPSIARIKREKRSSDSESKSSSSSDESDKDDMLRPHQIKSEKRSDQSHSDSDSSDDDTPTVRKVAVKREKHSDEENSKKATKRKPNVSVDDSFLDSTETRQGRANAKNARKLAPTLNDSIDQLMSSFQSPALSSTLKVETKSKRKK